MKNIIMNQNIQKKKNNINKEANIINKETNIINKEKYNDELEYLERKYNYINK